MKNIKIIVVLLVITFMLTFPTSCQNSGGNKSNTNNTVQGSSEIASTNETTATAPIDTIPIKNYNGKDFNFFMCDTFFTHRDVIAEELTGEAVNDAKYNRFRTVEDKYNIKINIIAMGDEKQTYDYLNKSVLTDDVKYDMTHVHAGSISQVVSAGLLMDWRKLPYPNFSNPWWNGNSISAMAIKNVLLLCPSAIELPYSSAICFKTDGCQQRFGKSVCTCKKRQLDYG